MNSIRKMKKIKLITDDISTSNTGFSFDSLGNYFSTINLLSK